MMGLGYLGSSSSSSSNLSPLAPPFTVGRSNHNKPVVHSNPVSHFNDPSYAIPFTSSWPYSHSSTARQESLADAPRRTSNDDYGYIIPDPNSSTTTHNWSGLNSSVLEQNIPGDWSAVNPSPKRVADTFSYNFTEAKPFYPPHAIAIASSVKNDDIPLVSFSEASCDLLSTSGLVHDDKTSHVDYTRSLSGLEYNPRQEGVWNRLPLPDGKPMETGDSFFSEEANITAASLGYSNYLNQGSAFGMETLNKGKDDPRTLYYADIRRRANNFGPIINGKSDGSSFFANNPNELSKGELNFTEFAMFSECHPLIKSTEDYPWNSHKSSPFEKRYDMFDCMSISSSKTKSAPLVIKPPASVSAQATASSSSSSSSVSLEMGNLNISDVVAAGSNNKPLKEKELHQGLESSGSFLLAPNQLSFQMGRTDEQHTFVVCPSSTKEDDLQLNFDFKTRPSFHVPDINIPNAETLDSGFDHHNPAEDSPCWKGAPSPHFEAQPPPTKKLQTAGNAQDSTQIDYCSFNHHSSDEKTSGPTTTTFFPFGKKHTGEGVDVGFTSIKVSSGGAQSMCDDTIKPNKGHEYSSTSSNANSQAPKLLDLPKPQQDTIIASPDAKKMNTANITIKPNKGHEYSSTSSNVNSQAPKLLDLPNPQEDAIITSPDAKKVNTASILVKALFDLSDLLLRDFTLDDKFALKEHHHETLDHVIRNLRVCMSRQVQVVSAHKLMFPQQKTSIGSQQVAYPGKSQVMNETSGLLHDGQVHKKPNSGAFDKNVEKLLEHASLRDTPPKDNNFVQAIKKVLDENLECEVELPSETLLYKNLWLEAEAELCSLSYRARFERLKRETRKHESTATDAHAAAIKEISSCNGSPDVKANGSKVLNAHNVDDVEASVMARFNILKRRGDQNPVRNTEEELARVKVTGSEVNVQHQLCKDDDVVVGPVKDDVDPWVTARLNILKCRGEPDAAIEIDKQVRDYSKERESAFQGEEEEEEEDDDDAAAVGSGSDWEHILKDDFSWRLS